VEIQSTIVDVRHCEPTMPMGGSAAEVIKLQSTVLAVA
jgi:hypothetical protein